MPYDVIIIGGGIIGAASAYELSKAGAKVLLIEKKHVGAGATGSSAAMLECQIDAHRREPFLSLARASLERFPALAAELKELTQIDVGFEQDGIIQLALTEEEASLLQTEAAYQTHIGLPARWIPMETLQNNFPQLNPIHCGGVLFEKDGQMNGERFLSAFIEGAKRQGTSVIENTGDWKFKRTPNRIEGIETNAATFNADRFLVAAGAWSDQILEPLGLKLGLEPLRGQLLVMDTPKRILPLPLYTKSNGYVTPKDGYTFVGTTVEKAGFLNTTTPEAKEELMQKGRRLLPQLSRTPARGMTSGLRPGSPDLLPALGRLPGFDNVFIAAGHYRNGILLAPITAKLMADSILSRPLSMDISSFSPLRFLKTAPAR